MLMSRRTLLRGAAAAGMVLLERRGLAAEPPALSWHDVEQWGVEGRGWGDLARKRYFDRLPAKAEGVVRGPVWSLSRHSAGMAAHFRTDAREIWVDYKLLSARLAMPHMPATGVSGLDLYGQTTDGTFRWVQVVKPTQQHMRLALVRGIDPGFRAYTLYLPLYNGVDFLKIGVPSGARFDPVPPRKTKPIVFYGTSIMHGACASRPGMEIPAIVGRRLNRPTINLGFSGNGTMDPEMGRLLAELDAVVYCIDCLPNMRPEAVRRRTAPLVRTLRAARPKTPILLVEDRVFTNARFFAAKRAFHRANHAALRAAYDGLVAAGVPQLFYLPGDPILGDDGEAATDGSHPSDLGMMRYAAAYQSALKPLLAQSG